MASSNEDMLSFWDYFVFGLTLASSSAIGIYYYLSGGRQRTNQEYLLGNSNMNVWVVSVSLMASFMSAITLLGVPAEIYSFGTIFFYINISYAIGTPMCAYFFLPVFYNLKATSAYEYLELRFSSKVRMVASATFMLQMIIYMGIVLYAPALALSAVTGLSKWASIISVGLVCTFYCCFGGIKAVLWTDFLQSALMFLALIAVCILGVIEVGGVQEVFDRAVEGGRINFDNFDPDPTVRHSFWSLVIGGIFIYASLFGVNQTQVQRLLTVKSLKTAQVALIVAWPITSLLSLSCVITGIVMYAYFKDCDPILAQVGGVTRADQLLPYFMLKIMGSIPGLPGLFIAGIFSGSLSSVSSFVNSLAAVTLEDFLKPVMRMRRIVWSEEKEACITKIIALFFGLICLLLTVVAEQMTGILEASLTIFGVVGGPLLGLFTLGMMSKRCSSQAAMIAFVISLAFGFWIGFGAVYLGPKPTPLPKTISQCQARFNLTGGDTSLYSLSSSWKEKSPLLSESSPAPGSSSSSFLKQLPDSVLVLSSSESGRMKESPSSFSLSTSSLSSASSLLPSSSSPLSSLPASTLETSLSSHRKNKIQSISPLSPSSSLSSSSYLEGDDLQRNASRGQEEIIHGKEDQDEIFYLYKLSYMYLAAITFFIEIILGQILSSSFLFPNEKNLMSNLISPLVKWNSTGSPSDDDINSVSYGLPFAPMNHDDAMIKNKSQDQGHDSIDRKQEISEEEGRVHVVSFKQSFPDHQVNGEHMKPQAGTIFAGRKKEEDEILA